MPKIDPARIEAALSDTDKATVVRWRRSGIDPWFVRGLAAFLLHLAVDNLTEQYLEQHHDATAASALLAACRHLGTTPKAVKRMRNRWGWVV